MTNGKKGIKVMLEEHSRLIEDISIEASELSFPKEHMPILEMHLIGRKLEANEIRRALSEVYESTGIALPKDEEEALIKSILAASRSSSTVIAK
ncbi:MAG: hypothetical protein QXW10_04160 [Candidatus Micrarchaeaceae archaeon]